MKAAIVAGIVLGVPEQMPHPGVQRTRQSDGFATGSGEFAVTKT